VGAGVISPLPSLWWNSRKHCNGAEFDHLPKPPCFSASWGYRFCLNVILLTETIRYINF
jgi:hypothetical protein